jgi:hypothetical protein
MDHGRAALLDPAHAAARPTPAAAAPTWVGWAVPSQPRTGQDTVSTGPAPQRHAPSAGPAVSAPAADHPARFRPQNVLLGAASALAAVGVVAAVLLAGPSDDPVGPAGASVAPPVPVPTAQGDAEATPCDGGTRTFVGGVTISRPGSVEAPVAGVVVRTSIKC